MVGVPLHMYRQVSTDTDLHRQVSSISAMYRQNSALYRQSSTRGSAIMRRSASGVRSKGQDVICQRHRSGLPRDISDRFPRQESTVRSVVSIYLDEVGHPPGHPERGVSRQEENSRARSGEVEP